MNETEANLASKVNEFDADLSNESKATSSETDVHCGICKEHYKKPTVSVKCGHIFCKDCWDTRPKTDSGKITCAACDVISETRHLRLNFNKQKEVQMHLKTTTYTRLQRTTQLLSHLAWSSKDIMHAARSQIDDVEADSKRLLQKIANSEKIMIELVREHHAALRQQVSSHMGPKQEEAKRQLEPIEPIVESIAPALDALHSFELVLLEESENYLKLRDSIDKAIEKGEKIQDDYVQGLKRVNLRLSKAQVEFRCPDIDAMNEFLQQHFQVNTQQDKTIDDTQSEMRQLYSRPAANMDHKPPLSTAPSSTQQSDSSERFYSLLGILDDVIDENKTNHCTNGT